MFINKNFRGAFLAIALPILLAVQQLNGYTFKCLDNCECDTDDSAIHCHSKGFTRLQLPSTKLRGFEVLGLTRNNLRVLPSEEMLLEKFPDLKAVDVEGNSDFDCDTLEQYKKLSVLSDCGKTPEELEEERAKLPTTAEPNQECDVGCQAERRARELHEYIKRLWEMIKEKLGKMAKQSGLDKFAEDVESFFREDVGGFFSDVGQKISNFHF